MKMQCQDRLFYHSIQIKEKLPAPYWASLIISRPKPGTVAAATMGYLQLEREIAASVLA